MRQAEWQKRLPEVCVLAREAGAVILRIYQEAHADGALLGQKSDDSPLTRADLAAHHAIVDGLALLTPDLPVVSEECADSLAHRCAQGSFWLIDPLDGTKEFLSRSDEFTVNIALITDGEPVWGVVYAPVLDQMYWGGRAFGALRQVGSACAPIHVSPPVAGGAPYRVVASKSHLNPETSSFIERLGPAELVQAGSSLKFCRIAEGSADVYPRLAPTCEWDTAAAQAVVEGAGGMVVDTAGAPLRYGKTDMFNPSFIAAAVPLAQLRGFDD